MTGAPSEGRPGEDRTARPRERDGGRSGPRGLARGQPRRPARARGGPSGRRAPRPRAPADRARGALYLIEETELGPVNGLDVLHPQCHLGRDGVTFAQPGARVTGVDFSEPAVEAAGARARELGLSAPFVPSDVHGAPGAPDGERFGQRPHPWPSATGCPTSGVARGSSRRARGLGPAPASRTTTRRRGTSTARPRARRLAGTPHPLLRARRGGLRGLREPRGAARERPDRRVDAFVGPHRHGADRRWAAARPAPRARRDPLADGLPPGSAAGEMHRRPDRSRRPLALSLSATRG